MTDLNAILAPILAGGNPWLLLAGAAAVILYNRFGPKPPATPSPNPTPGPNPAPSPAPQPVPEVPGRPVLTLLARILARVAPLIPIQAAAGGLPPEAAPLGEATVADLVKAKEAIEAELAARADLVRQHLGALNLLGAAGFAAPPGK